MTLFIQMKALPVPLAVLSRRYLSYNLKATSIVTAYFSLSLGVNTLVTALIVYRIITVTNDIRGFGTGKVQAIAHGQRDLYPLISILIESGLMTFVGQLAQPIMFKFANFAFPLVRDPVVMLYVRAFMSVVGCRFGVLISSTFYTGNFDDSCPCACRDGRFLRSL